MHFLSLGIFKRKDFSYVSSIKEKYLRSEGLNTCMSLADDKKY